MGGEAKNYQFGKDWNKLEGRLFRFTIGVDARKIPVEGGREGGSGRGSKASKERTLPAEHTCSPGWPVDARGRRRAVELERLAEDYRSAANSDQRAIRRGKIFAVLPEPTRTWFEALSEEDQEGLLKAV
jgi:hypothetical protein